MNTDSQLTFETSSGSIYEIDQREKRIRWLGGERRHRSFPPDRQWREFHSIDYPEIGTRCVIVWSVDHESGRCDHVITSRVRAINGLRAA